MSIMKKKVIMDDTDISTIGKQYGNIYVTQINNEQTNEKKKVSVEVPFQNGKTDVSYAFADKNYYNDMPFVIVVDIVGNVKGTEKSITANAMKLFKELEKFITDKIGTIETKTSDDDNTYNLLHLSTNLEKGTVPEHLIATFNFETKSEPYSGGAIEPPEPEPKEVTFWKHACTLQWQYTDAWESETGARGYHYAYFTTFSADGTNYFTNPQPNSMVAQWRNAMYMGGKPTTTSNVFFQISGAALHYNNNSDTTRGASLIGVAFQSTGKFAIRAVTDLRHEIVYNVDPNGIETVLNYNEDIVRAL